jgi:hypothetical protein
MSKKKWKKLHDAPSQAQEDDKEKEEKIDIAKLFAKAKRKQRPIIKSYRR